MCIADRRNKIVYLLVENAIDRFANDLILRADLAADRQHRTAKDRTALLLARGQAVVDAIEVAFEPLDRRNRGRKERIHVRFVLAPLGLERRRRQLRLRLEK